MTPAPPYPAEIRALTGLRYAAAAWVLVYHVTFFVRDATWAGLPVVTAGYLGVDFFFVLSGFVLTHVYQPQIERGRFDFWDFVAKRFARIYPMHIVTLLAFVAIGLAARAHAIQLSYWVGGVSLEGVDSAVIFRGLVAHITMIHAWGATPGLMFNQPSWSISAEWFAYLMFPLLVLLRRLPPHGERLKLAAVAALFLLVAAAMEIGLHSELTRLSWNAGILRILPEFLLGMTLHRLGERRSAGATGAVVGVAASTAAVVAALIVGAFLPRLASMAAAVAVLGLAALVFFVADADRYGRLALLRTRTAVLLGEISYSVYMLHLGVGILLFDILAPGFRANGPWQALGAIVGNLALTTLLSLVTYRLIEVPARRWLVARARRLNHAPTPAPIGNPADAR